MNESTKEVEKVQALAKEAGQSLNKIIEGAEKVVDISMQVAVASEEQSGTSEEISRSIIAISSVTNQTSTGIQQIAKASEDLRTLTSNLQELLGIFKIDKVPASRNNDEGDFAVRPNGKITKTHYNES